MTVLHCADLPQNALSHLLCQYQINIKVVVKKDAIPGSFWGESEAGLIDNNLYIRNTTPVHSALHEACHYVCMDKTRRNDLHTNAGGDYDEENAVCYLQLILSNYLTGYNQEQHFLDMDKWGYSFRLGSAKRWFMEDAEDAQLWLRNKKLINQKNEPNWQLRDN